MNDITITIKSSNNDSKYIAKAIENLFKQFSINVENHCIESDVNVLVGLLDVGMKGGNIIIKESNEKIEPVITKQKPINTLPNIPTSFGKEKPNKEVVNDFKDLDKLITKNKKDGTIDKRLLNKVPFQKRSTKHPFELALEHPNYVPPTINNTKEEMYVPLPGHTMDYEISNFGNVKSITRVTAGGKTKMSKKLSIQKSGFVSLSNGSKLFTYKVAKLVYGTFRGVYPDVILPIDGNRHNFRLSNLEIFKGK